MDFSFILRQLQNILINNRITLIPLAFIILSFLVFLLSRTFRKTGLFVLALAFGLDYTIRSIPFDIYYNFPRLYNFITILYILGFIIFFIKILKILVRMAKLGLHKSDRKENKLKIFFTYTGLFPFLLMLIANVLGLDRFIGSDIIRILTSISFIYMIFKTVYSTYKFLSTKESIILGDKMDFREIKEYLNNNQNTYKNGNSKNQGRRIRKKQNSEVFVPDETIKIDADEINQKISMANIDHESDNKKETLSRVDNKNKAMSNTGLIDLVSGGFDKSHNQTTMIIINLKSGEKLSYTSFRPILKIQEDNEYKVDLEFESVNEYDYGRFIDLLLKYSKDKKAYKFELIVSPKDDLDRKIIFFDPSNIYDIDEKDYANVTGKIISMNFPKYKINFITGN